jgi:hypothetical protein
MAIPLALMLVMVSVATAPSASAADLDVRIDIKAGSHPNAVNLKSGGVLPVAVFGNSSFDISQVDLSTVCIRVQSSASCGAGAFAVDASISAEDLNSDGFADDVFHFTKQNIGLTGVKNQQRTLCVEGQLLDGTTFEGCQGVLIVNS